MAKRNLVEETRSGNRYTISLIIIASSIVGIFTLSIYGIYSCSMNPETVFTALIGIVGTWVGTVLAFYFSKDNFEAASRSTQKLVDSISTKEKLDSVLSKDVMINLSEIKYLKLEKESKEYTLSSLLEIFLKTNNRLPVFSSEMFPNYILHRSFVDRFISEKMLDTTVDIKTLTLYDLLNDVVLGTTFRNGFITIKGTISLGDAKIIMDNKSDTKCSDIFITENGTKSSKVVGWITDKIIAENSKV